MRIEARASVAGRLFLQASLVTRCLKVRPVCRHNGGLSSLDRVNELRRFGESLAPWDAVA